MAETSDHSIPFSGGSLRTKTMSLGAAAILACAAFTAGAQPADVAVEPRSLIGKSPVEALAALRSFSVSCTSASERPLDECGTLAAVRNTPTGSSRMHLFVEAGRVVTVQRVVSSSYKKPEVFSFMRTLASLLAAQPRVVYATEYSDEKEPDGSTLQTIRFRAPGRTVTVTHAFDLKDNEGKLVEPFVQLDETFK